MWVKYNIIQVQIHTAILKKRKREIYILYLHIYGPYYHLLTKSTGSPYWFENKLTKNEIIIHITFTLEICTPKFVFIIIYYI